MSNKANEKVAKAPADEGFQASTIRLRKSLHRELKIRATMEGQSLQDLINQACEEFLASRDSVKGEPR